MNGKIQNVSLLDKVKANFVALTGILIAVPAFINVGDALTPAGDEKDHTLRLRTFLGSLASLRHMRLLDFWRVVVGRAGFSGFPELLCV